MRQCLFAFLAALLLAVPAMAQPVDVATVVANATNEDLKAGFKAYDGLEFEAGLKSFKGALEAKLSPAERTAAALYAGLIAQSLADEAGAKAFFEQAIAATPEVELPGDAPPKTQLTFAEVKRAWKAKAPPADDHLEAADIKPEPEMKPVAADDAAQVSKPIYEQWWLWTLVGVVVVGGVAAGVAAGASGGSAPCGGSGVGCIDITVPGVWRNR